jgi:hypothetical protein
MCNRIAGARSSEKSGLILTENIAPRGQAVALASSLVILGFVVITLRSIVCINVCVLPGSILGVRWSYRFRNSDVRLQPDGYTCVW